MRALARIFAAGSAGRGPGGQGPSGAAAGWASATWTSAGVPFSAGSSTVSGTIPTMGGELVYADRLDFELEDPVRNEIIRHHYDVTVH